MPSQDRRDDDDHYLDLTGLARYSGLSPSTLRRYLRDPEHPLPHHYIRGTGKARGRLLFRKAEFDAWVRGAAPPPPPDVGWIRKAFDK
jgi:Helix-turn-helix domain